MMRFGIAVLLIALGTAPAASAFDSQYEARNYAKINERAASDYTPAFNAQLAQQGAVNEAQGSQILAVDGPQATYGRNPTGNLCFHHGNGCAGDIRLYGWGAKGYGIVKPILFTQRNGATLSGHVWMTRSGPAQRPGVVITNGSIQAPEQLYWWAAETLAKDGYIVLTFDPQGQGYSDTYGEGTDRMDGVPSQSGGPFFFGTEDAVDFFFSTPADPYKPRPSCSTGTSHVNKQRARVNAGRASAYNPFWQYLDASHVGLAGHSLGAAGVSYIGQLDPRVKAIVAWDNLADVISPTNLSGYGQKISCPSQSSRWPTTLPVTKPALGMSDDYGLAPAPFTAAPDPTSKNKASLALSKAGVDSGELSVRGGTHYEFSYIPNPGFGATHRGIDMADWYTLAWFDKYLKGEPGADARLKTSRWRNDAAERKVDDQLPADGNLFSTYLTSRLDFGLKRGGRFDCENMRPGCAGMTTSDGWPAAFSFLSYANTPDSKPTPGSTTGPGGATGSPPGANHGPGSRCAHAGAPRSQIVRIRVGGAHHWIWIRGTAHAGRCDRLRRVLVAIGLRVRSSCRFLDRAGRYAAASDCHRLRFLSTSGASRWSIRISGTLLTGRYLIYSRAVNGGGAFERKKRRGSDFRHLRII